MQQLHDRRLKRREEHHLLSDGTLVVEKKIDAEPVMDMVKASSEIQTPRRDSGGMLHLGSVDPLTAANWAKECGAAIGTKEFAAYAKKKLMSGDFAHFQVKRKPRYV